MSFRAKDIFFPAEAGGVKHGGANYQNLQPGKEVPEQKF